MAADGEPSGAGGDGGDVGLRLGDTASNTGPAVSPASAMRQAALRKACDGLGELVAGTANEGPAQEFGKQLDLTVVRVDEVAAMLETVSYGAA